MHTITARPPTAAVTFCDGSTEEKVFEDTAYSKLLAREFIQEMAASGIDHSVINQAPHVVEIFYREGGVSFHEQYRCRCMAVSHGAA